MSTTDSTIQCRVEDLAAAITAADHAYATGDVTMIDADYDQLRGELAAELAAHPHLTPDPNPLDRIWAPAEITEPVRHAQPMLGMAKIAPPDRVAGVTAFAAQFTGSPIMCMPKMDGVSASCLFVDGELRHVATRGNGRVGENITAVARAAVRCIPTSIEPVGARVEVRGEIVMFRSTMALWNASTAGRPLANPRAAAAGVLGLKNPSQAEGRELHFFAFDLTVDGVSWARPDLEDELRLLSFTPVPIVVCDDVPSILEAIDAIERGRLEGNVDIDGAVLRVGDTDVYRSAGARSDSARGATAVKFPPEERVTILLNVTWTVGAGGKVVPNAVLERVRVAGTNITAATLANQEIIWQRGLKIGQRVVVCRRGDVIPFVVGPAPGEQPANVTAIEPPDSCPSCDGALTERGAGRELYCTNVACPAQATRRLMHWASRVAADIDAVGEVWIQRLFDGGLLRRPEDFYRLTAADLLRFPGIGETSAARMVASIDQSRKLGLRRALIGLGIRHAREGTAQRLCRAGYESIEAVAAATSSELQRVNDIGVTVADSIVEFFRREETQATLRAMRSAAVDLDVLAEDRAPTIWVDTATASLAGEVVVITGAVSNPYTQEKITRDAFARLLEQLGATVSSSVSSQTNKLICGANVGASKTAKAEHVGAAVVSQDQIWPLLRDAHLA